MRQIYRQIEPRSGCQKSLCHPALLPSHVLLLKLPICRFASAVVVVVFVFLLIVVVLLIFFLPISSLLSLSLPLSLYTHLLDGNTRERNGSGLQDFGIYRHHLLQIVLVVCGGRLELIDGISEF